MSLEKLEIYNVKRESVNSENELSNSPTNIQDSSKNVTSEDSLETRNQRIRQSKTSPSQKRNDISSRSAKNVRGSPKNIQLGRFQTLPKNVHTSPRRSQNMSLCSIHHSSPTSTPSTRSSTRSNSPITSSTSSTSSTRLNSPFARQNLTARSPETPQQNILEETEQGNSDSDIRIEKDKIVIKINLKHINQKKKRKKKQKKYKKSKEKSTKKNKIHSNVLMNIESDLEYSSSSEPLEEQGRSDSLESSSHTLGFNEQPVFNTNPFAVRRNDGAIRINSGVIVKNRHARYSLRNNGDMNARLSQEILELTHETLHTNYNKSMLTNNNNMIANQVSCASVTEMKDSVNKVHSSGNFQNGMISNLAIVQQRRAGLYQCKSVREMLLQSASVDDLQHTSNKHTNSNDLDYLDRLNNNSKFGYDINDINQKLGSLERLAENSIDLTEEDAVLDNEFIDIHALETLIPYETYLQNVRNSENETTNFEYLRNTENGATPHVSYGENIIKVSPKLKANKSGSDPIGNIRKTIDKLPATAAGSFQKEPVKGFTPKLTETMRMRANMAEKLDVMSTSTSTKTATKGVINKVVNVPNTIRIDKTFCEIREIRAPPPSDDIELIEANVDCQLNESTHNQSHAQTHTHSNDLFSTNTQIAQYYLQKAPSKTNVFLKTMPKPTQAHVKSTINDQYQALPTNANRTSRNNNEYDQPSLNKLSISPLLRSQTKQCQTKQSNSTVNYSVCKLFSVEKYAKSPTQISANSAQTSVVRQSTSAEELVLRPSKTRNVSKYHGKNTQSNSKDSTVETCVIPLEQASKNKSQIKCIKSSVGETRPQENPKDVENLNGLDNSSVSQEIFDLSEETSNKSKTTSPIGITDGGVKVHAIHSTPKSSAKEDQSKSSNLVDNYRDKLQKVPEGESDNQRQNNVNEPSAQETLFEALNLFKDRNNLAHNKQKKQHEINNLLLEFDRLDEDSSSGNKIETFMSTLESTEDSTLINPTDKKVMTVSDKRNADTSGGVEHMFNCTKKMSTENHVEPLHVNNAAMENPLERALDLISKLGVSTNSRLNATSSHVKTCTVRETRKSYRLEKLLKDPKITMNDICLDDTENRKSRKDAREGEQENEVQKEDTVDKVDDSLKDKQRDQEEALLPPQEASKRERIHKLQKEPNMSNTDVETRDTILSVTENTESEVGIKSHVQKEVQFKITKDVACSSSSRIQRHLVSPETSKEYVKQSVDNKQIHEVLPGNVINDESKIEPVKTQRKSARLNKDASKFVERDEFMNNIEDSKSNENVNEGNANGRKQIKKITPRKGNEEMHNANANSFKNLNIDKEDIEKINNVNELKCTKRNVSEKIINLPNENKSETTQVDEKSNRVFESAMQPIVRTRGLRPRELSQTNKQTMSIKRKKKTKLEGMKIGIGLRKTVTDINKSWTVSNMAKSTTEVSKRIPRIVNISNLNPIADTSTDKLKKIVRRSCSLNIKPKLETSATIGSGFISINRDSLRRSVRQSTDSTIGSEKKSFCCVKSSIAIGIGFTGIINRGSLRPSVRQRMDSNIDSERKKYCKIQRKSFDVPKFNDAAGARKDSAHRTFTENDQTETNKPRKAAKKKIHVMLERKNKRKKRKIIGNQTEEQIRNNEITSNFILPNNGEFKTEKIRTNTRKKKVVRKQIGSMKSERKTRSTNERLSEAKVLKHFPEKSGFLEDKTKTTKVEGKIATKKTKHPYRKPSRFNMRKSTSLQNKPRQSERLLRRTILKQNEINLSSHLTTRTKKKHNSLKNEVSNVVDVKKEWKVSSVSQKKQGKEENRSKYHKTIRKNVNKTKNEDVNSEYENEIRIEMLTRVEIKKEKLEPEQGTKEIIMKSEKNTIVEIHNGIGEQILKKKRKKLNKDTSVSKPNKQADNSTNIETNCKQNKETGNAKRGRPLGDDSRLKLKVELLEMNNTRQADVYDFQDDLETAVPPAKKNCKDSEQTAETLNQTHGKTKSIECELTESTNKHEENERNFQDSNQMMKLRGRPLKCFRKKKLKLKTELVENNKFVQRNVYNYKDNLESIGTEPTVEITCKEESGLINGKFDNRSGLIDDGNTRNSENGNEKVSNELGVNQPARTSLTKTVAHKILKINQPESNHATTQNKMSTRNIKTGANIKVNKGNLYKIIQSIKSEIKEKNLIKTETTATAGSENVQTLYEKQGSNVGNVSQSVQHDDPNKVRKDTSKPHSNVHKESGTLEPVLDIHTYKQITIEEADVEQSGEQFNAELLNSNKIKREQLQYYASQARLPNLTDIKVDKKHFLEKCPLCEKMYRSLFRMKHHVRSVHAGQLFDCDCCSESFIDKQLYDDHMKSHDDGIDCKLCCGKFTKDNIRDHLVLHIQADQRGRLSDRCFNKKQTSLLTHFLTKNKFKLQCHLCEDTFCPRSNVRRHYSTKHSDKKISYTCERCNKRFSLLHNLKRHLAIHEGITYECRLCDRKYSRLSDYKTHLNIHNGTKYQCPICFKCASRPSYLKKHMSMLHQGRGYDNMAYRDCLAKTDEKPSRKNPSPPRSVQ